VVRSRRRVRGRPAGWAAPGGAAKVSHCCSAARDQPRLGARHCHTGRGLGTRTVCSSSVRVESSEAVTAQIDPAVASTAGATYQERLANFLAISLELKKAKKPMTSAQRRVAGQSKGGKKPLASGRKKRSDAGTTRGPKKKKRSDVGTAGVRKKRSDAGTTRGPNKRTTTEKELLAAQARANNNSISDAFTKAKMAKKKGH
jgi:hypothetical protein